MMVLNGNGGLRMRVGLRGDGKIDNFQPYSEPGMVFFSFLLSSLMFFSLWFDGGDDRVNGELYALMASSWI